MNALKLSFLSVIVALMTGLFISGVATQSVSAFDPTPDNSVCGSNRANSSACKVPDNPKNPVVDIIAKATIVLAWAIGVISVIMIIYAGFTFVTSAGDSNKVARARSIIIYALIGLVVAVSAGTIINYVLSKL